MGFDSWEREFKGDLYVYILDFLQISKFKIVNS